MRRLGAHFPKMTLVGRDPDRHRSVLEDLTRQGIEARLVECDLQSLDSVARAVSEVEGSLDVIVANAGVAGRRGVTDDGFELHFGVNHLAHHLLVTGLADRIQDRVVVVSSNAHYDSDGLDLSAVRDRTESFTGLPEYRDSKLANVMFGRELARRTGLTTHIVHPGVVATEIWRRIPWPIRPLVTRRMASPEDGADTPAWAATEDGLVSGGYYARRTLWEPSPHAQDETASSALWERSEEWVEPFREQTG